MVPLAPLAPSACVVASAQVVAAGDEGFVELRASAPEEGAAGYCAGTLKPAMEALREKIAGATAAAEAAARPEIGEF